MNTNRSEVFAHFHHNTDMTADGRGLLESNPSRRDFMRSAGESLLVAGAITLPHLAALASPGKGELQSPPAQGSGVAHQRYRAVSWWVTWEDLTWPNEALKDKIKRRAARCEASGVNCCIIFGAHFRWDFMPLWGRLHDLLRFIGDELHARKIQLFDHHSSVLVHRPRNRDEELNIWRKNLHHVPFYPSRKSASDWRFHGSRLDDWRMIDVESGQPAYLPAYNAEQFCMNNASFQAAYTQYLKQLIEDTAIDGLMSDDGIFYPAWQACRCPSCLSRFKNDYGHELPPTSDAAFWGNRQSRAFRDWVEMRFRTSGDFLAIVRDSLPKGFPLLTCCSSSDDQAMTGYGMSYQEFIRSCNLVLLEMVGSTPSIKGTWDNRISSQMLHLAIARDSQADCIGLGYGFFPDTAFFIWALNKFLGSDCWFSTLKGRLDATPEERAELADESELVDEAFHWESAHPQLFIGEVDSDIADFYSRSTRDFYGQVPGDYVADYQTSCLQLLRANISYEVVTQVPRYGRFRRLVLSSSLCLSADEKSSLDQFMKEGGTVIATGPNGFYDQRADKVAVPWLGEYGIACELVEPNRTGSFPPYKNLGTSVPLAECRATAARPRIIETGWFNVPVGNGCLYWRPERASSKGTAYALIKLLESEAGRNISFLGLPASWQVRKYQDGDRLLIHALPSQVVTKLHPTLVNQVSGERVVEKLIYSPLSETIFLSIPGRTIQRLTLHSPDLATSRAGKREADGRWSIDPAGVSRYLILEYCEC
jgi:hypothetical protein